ncbi:hypothetical protein ACLM5H_05180 [Fredinandcohnia humi]
MGVVTARGKEAKEAMKKKKQNIDFKKVFVRLKDGDSVRVRILSAYDYVRYMSHGSYVHGIWTQPCLKPAGKNCAICEANDAKVEEFDGLYAKERYLFAFADIDEGMIRVFDATKGQAEQLVDTIEQYAEDLQDVAFTFKRTGNKTDTTYTLNPILRLKADDKEKFEKFNEEVVEDEFFETVLQPRTYEQQIEELKKAGFPVEEYFDVQVSDDSEDNSDDVEPISEEENPDKVF